MALPPQNLYACRIVSATYGSRDTTAWIQKKLYDYRGSGADHSNTWSFTVGNDFFGLDPNVGVPKMAVVTYQFDMPDDVGRSQHITATGSEGQTITIQCPQTLTRFTWPEPGLANECIVAAYWWNKNVTSPVNDCLVTESIGTDYVDGIVFPVGTDVLGDDPAPGISKQLTVVYAKYISGKWYQCTVVDLRAERYDFVIPPASPPIARRRLNIYAAVWGGKDYTAYVRNKYFSDILGVTQGRCSINDKENIWSLDLTQDFFGPDPLPNQNKTFTIVYRIATIVGVQDGKLIDPNAPAVWTEQWYQQQPALLSTSQYPILRDVSGFQVVTQYEGGLPLTVDLGQWADMTPLNMSPVENQIVAAGYDSQYVLQATRDLQIVEWGQSNSFVVNPTTFKIQDPSPGRLKQFVAVYAIPLEAQIGFHIRTLIGLDGATLTVPTKDPGLNPQWPQVFSPPTYRSITFTNHGLADGWPQVYKNGQVQWCPRPSAGQIALGNQGKWFLNFVFRDSITVDLINDAGCKDRDKVQVNFNIQSFDDSPLSDEMYVASEPNSSFETIYNIDGAEVEFFYILGRAGQFFAQFGGIILDVIEAMGESIGEA